jgi:glycine/D-amino acid oxidase-like deaminating enzyme
MKALIIGGGIAGICTAIELQKKNVHCTVIDQGTNVSTRIAAGMINPIVFRRTTKSWRADEFFPCLEDFYSEIEKTSDDHFFHPIVIRRIFSSEQERAEWLKKEKQEKYNEFLAPISIEDDEFKGVDAPFGTGRVNKAFWVDSDRFNKHCIHQVSQNGIWITEPFDYFLYKPETVEYKSEKYDFVIFCEGFAVKNNPLFNNLKIESTKGQVLKIIANDLSENESLNRKCFVLPVGNKEFKIGSTYEWKARDSNITEEGKNQILTNYHILGLSEPHVIEQNAGIRPTTFDRRPFIGEHPQLKRNYIFNGLGTKGYMLAPLLAKELVAHILHDEKLDPEVSLNRTG